MAKPTQSGSWPTTLVVPHQVYHRTQMAYPSAKFSEALRSVMGDIVRLLKSDRGQLEAIRAISRGEGLRHGVIEDHAKFYGRAAKRTPVQTRMTVNLSGAMISEIEDLIDRRAVGMIMRAALFVLFEREAARLAAKPHKRAAS